MRKPSASATTALAAGLVALLAAGRGPAQTSPAPAAAPPVAAPISINRALFQYRRTPDASLPAGGLPVTTVRINAADPNVGRAVPVSQNVFGNFVEHLGGAVYPAVWANALLNPNLERIEERDTAPQAWELTGPAAAATESAWRDGTGYLSPRAVRLAGAGAALSQRTFLPTYRTRGYVLTLWIRAGENAPQNAKAGGVAVSLRAEADGAPAGQSVPAEGRVIWQTNLPVSEATSGRRAGTTWRKHTIRLRLPAGALAKGQLARFTLAPAAENNAGSSLDVDQIELFPDDAVNGLDPDVLRRAREWRMPVLRLAGNFSSGYHWKNGVGPRESRPTLRNPAWGGAEPHHFGTGEFLDFARHAKTVPQIAANAGNGTPEEAADWVRYTNARSALRVPLWEIGNELYGGWQIGHTDPAGNAERFVRFREAMLRADPRIQIIATGKGDEFQPDGLARNRAWNEAVLRAAVAGGKSAPEYLSIHPLVSLPANLRQFSFAEQYESAMAHPAFVDQILIPSLVDTIRATVGPNARTRIAPTEWGIIVGGPGWRESPNHDAVSGAVFNALTLNAFLRNADQVTLANMTALTHGGGIKKPRGVVLVDPQYYTQQLYARAAPRFPVAATWTGPGRDVPARGFLPAVAAVPDIDVFSALTADKKRLVTFLVNRHLSEARPVRLNLSGFPPGRVSATILTHENVQAGNTWDSPDNVVPRPFYVPARPGDDWTLTLPPHALVVLTVEQDAGRGR